MILLFSKDNEKMRRVSDALRSEGHKVTCCNPRGFNPRNDVIQCQEVRLLEENEQIRRAYERYSEKMKAAGQPAIPVILHRDIPEAEKVPTIAEMRGMQFFAKASALKKITGKSVQNAIEAESRFAELEANGHP